MNSPEQLRHRQRSIVFVAMLLFNLVLVLLQLWLFAGALEEVVAGRSVRAVVAALVSLGIFAVNVWIYAGLRRMERGP